MNVEQRKSNRIDNYDYSQNGAYFITICTANREKLFWLHCRGELRSPDQIPLSPLGVIADNEIKKMNTIYDCVRIDKYCVMPDHIHMILTIEIDTDGRTQFAPTISRVIKQFKGAVTKQVGKSVWQRSFYDHIIRNQQDYDEIWEYIENNPRKWAMTR